MTQPARHVRIDSLLEHASWVRRLARSLVGPDDADDLAQDVWMAALRRPPEREGARGSVRGWLGRVLVNRARERRRGAARRESRERQVAAGERVDDPLERLVLHRELVERVGELAEPWRATLLARYFDELSLKEIAARDGVPVSTVNTRLRRAKELLREKLDDAHGGDRRSWSLALASLASPRGAAPLAPLTPAVLTGIGAPLLVMKLLTALSAVAVAALAAFFLLPERGAAPVVRPAERPLEPALVQALEPAPESEPLAQPGPAAERRAVESSTPLAAPDAAPAPQPAEEPAAALVGRVVDTAGRAMPGLAVWLAEPRDERLLAVSAADGSFPVDGERDLGHIEVRDEAWGTALGCRLPRGAHSGPTLVVAPWIELGGTVLDEEGGPIERAQLVVAQPSSLRASVGDLHDSSVSYEPLTRSDALGAFRFERMLAVEGATLLVQAQGFADLELPLPLYSTLALEVVLRRPQASADAVRGQVVDGSGRGVPDAWVSLGYLCARTDAAGNFRLATGREGGFDRVVAAKAGHPAAVLERPRNAATGEAEPWPEFLLLRLGDTPLRLAGRVTNAAGKPLVGWKVWLADPTFFSSIDQRGVMAEGLALGLLDERGEDERPTAAWPWTRTDARGRFELGGLLDRDYSLKVFDEDSLLLVEAGPFPAGRGDVEVVVDLGRLYGPVAGRVTDAGGAPVEGATVDTWVATYTVPHDEQGILWWSEDGDSVTTDEDGRYRLKRLPRDGVTLHVKHPDILPQDFDLHRAEDGRPVGREDWDAIDFVVERRFHLQLEVSPALAESGSITLLDEDGEETLIQVFSAGGHMSTHRYHFSEGRTEVLSVLGSVREVVLHDGEGNELARRGVSLVFGELNVVRL